MITTLFNNPRVITQEINEQYSLREDAIAAHTDNGGLIILSQSGNDILIDPNSVKDLIKVLKELRALVGDKA